MRTDAALLAAVAVLGCGAAAQPSRHRAHAAFHNRALIQKRDADVVVTQYEFVTMLDPSVTVYVDSAGKVLYSDVKGPPPASAPTSPVLYSTPDTPAAPPAAPTGTTDAAAANNPPPPSPPSPPSGTKTTNTPATPAPSPPAAEAAPAPPQSYGSPPAAAPPAPKPAPPPPSDGKDPTAFKGIAYSPYSGSFGQNVGCKSASDVAKDFGMIDAGTYDVVRIYGTDCNQVANVLAAAKPKGIRLYAGIYDVTNWKAEIDIISAAVQGDWSGVHTVSVGNEAVSNGQSADTVLDSLSKSRAYLKSLGYGGWVVAVDTFMLAKSDPRLCQQSDYSAVNMHPYWDLNTASDQAGSFVTAQIAELKAADLCGSKPLVISETGWPSSGKTLGKAVCSPQDQAAAVSSIGGALSQHGYVLLSAFDDYWKNPGPDDVEQKFGLLGNAPSG